MSSRTRRMREERKSIVVGQAPAVKSPVKPVVKPTAEVPVVKPVVKPTVVVPRRTAVPEPTQRKRQELKAIRTGQAALSTNIHLLQRKAQALRDANGVSSTKDSRVRIKQIESYNKMADRTINQSNQIKARTLNSYNTTKAEKNTILANRDLYSKESLDRYITDFDQYEADAQSIIRKHDDLIKSLEGNKVVNVQNITKIKDWTGKKGERVRDIQLQRIKLPLGPTGPGYTVRWVEGGEEKSARFETPDQLDSFLERTAKRSELSDIRLTGAPSRTPAKGPLSGLENLTWKYQTLIDLKKTRPPTDGEVTRHPWSRMGKYDTSNPEDMKNALLWAATQTATGAIKAVPFVIGGTVGAVTMGPWGAVFVPAAMASFALPSVTTLQMKEDFLEYVEEHPELYTEIAFQALGGAAVARLGTAGLNKVRSVAANRVKMTSRQYLEYLRSRPWSGQMAAQEQIGWIDKLVGDILDRVVPEYSHVAGPRTRNVGKDVSFRATRVKDVYWKVPESSLFRGDEAVTVTLMMPKIESSLWWAVVSTPGGYNKIRDSLSDRGLSEIEIDSILVAMGKSQEIFSAPIMDSLDVLKPIDLEFLKDLTLPDLEQLPILIPDLDVFPDLDVLQDVDVDVEQLQDQEELQDLDIDPIQDVDPIEEPPQLLQPEQLVPERLREGRARDAPSGTQPLGRRGRRVPIRVRKLSMKIPPSKKPEPYQVKFQYNSGASETKRVNAKTYQQAYNTANRQRRIKDEPIQVEVEKL